MKWRVKKQRCQLARGVNMTRGERGCDNRLDKRHERSATRGAARQEAEVLVDGKRGCSKRQYNNHPDNINERGLWQQKQQQSCAATQQSTKKKGSKMRKSYQWEVAAPAPQWWG